VTTSYEPNGYVNDALDNNLVRDTVGVIPIGQVPMRSRTSKVVFITAVLALVAAHPIQAQQAHPALAVDSPRHGRVTSADTRALPANWPSEAAVAKTPTSRYILIGAGIGAGIGAIIGAISVHNHPPPPGGYGPGRRGTIVGVGIVGAISGAIVGWLVSIAARA
jgi:hypothetical protein